MKILIWILFLSASQSMNVTDTDEESFRKHFGLSFNICKDYVKSFKCMSVCKSIGFQIFRLDKKCKCSCFEMKTTTVLPFFKWRTNGTTRSLPKTYSPRLYDMVGTLSPFPDEMTTINITDLCPTLGVGGNCSCNSNITSVNATTEAGTSVSSDGAEGSNNASSVSANADDVTTTPAPPPPE